MSRLSLPYLFHPLSQDTDGQPSLATRLASALEEKDLGSTGFVTVNEIAAAMVSEFQVRRGNNLTVPWLRPLFCTQLSRGEVETLMRQLGLEDAEGRGIEYTGLTHTIAEAIQLLQDQWQTCDDLAC